MTDQGEQSSGITLFTSPPIKPTPAPNQPGTLADQFLTVAVSLHLAEITGGTAAEQWDRARREVMGVGR